MPIYEYVCERCDHGFETLVRGSAEPACPRCDARELRRRLSPFAVSSQGRVALREPAGGCGTCGDPRGPGSCSLPEA